MNKFNIKSGRKKDTTADGSELEKQSATEEGGEKPQGAGRKQKLGLKQGMLRRKAKGFTAQAKGKLCFAFDFGEYAIKIAVGKISNGKVEVKHLILLENDDRKTMLTSANLADWRKKISREFSKRNLNPSGNLGLVSVGSRNYISRQIEIPYASDEDRQGLVAYEMSANLSLDMNAYLFQHKVLRAYENSGVKMCTVWAAAVQKEQCELYYDLLDSLKLKPTVMDINVNGMERFMAEDGYINDFAAGEVVVAVDFGIRGTEVGIYHDGTYVVGTHLELGDGRLVSAAKNALGVQIADIHNGNKLIVPPKTVYEILARSSQSETARLFRDAVEEWLSEIERVVRQYEVGHPNELVSRLLLYGGSPQLSWLKAYLEKYLNVPAEIVQSTNCFRMTGRASKTEYTAAQYLNALALLLIK